MSDEIEKRQEFMDQMSQYIEEHSWPKDWDDAKKKKAAEIVNRSSTKTAMYSMIPLRCRGDKCPFARVCPLVKEEMAPVGGMCPIEYKRVVDLYHGFMKALDVDDDNLIEAAMLRDLVDIEIQILRKAIYLSEEDFIQDVVIGVDQSGRPIHTKQLHVAVEQEDRLFKKKAALLKQFAATREMRIKAGAAAQDTAQTLSTIMDEFTRIQMAREKLTKAKLELPDVIDVDEDDDVE